MLETEGPLDIVFHRSVAYFGEDLCILHHKPKDVIGYATKPPPKYLVIIKTTKQVRVLTSLLSAGSTSISWGRLRVIVRLIKEEVGREFFVLVTGEIGLDGLIPVKAQAA